MWKTNRPCGPTTLASGASCGPTWLPHSPGLTSPPVSHLLYFWFSREVVPGIRSSPAGSFVSQFCLGRTHTWDQCSSQGTSFLREHPLRPPNTCGASAITLALIFSGWTITFGSWSYTWAPGISPNLTAATIRAPISACQPQHGTSWYLW